MAVKTPCPRPGVVRCAPEGGVEDVVGAGVVNDGAGAADVVSGAADVVSGAPDVVGAAHGPPPGPL